MCGILLERPFIGAVIGWNLVQALHTFVGQGIAGIYHAEEDPKLNELWTEINTVPEWVDWDQIQRGQDVRKAIAEENILAPLDLIPVNPLRNCVDLSPELVELWVAEEDPKLNELWTEINTVPEWVDWDQIQRGQDVLTVLISVQSSLSFGSSSAWSLNKP
jgi:hypothetical protein